MKIKKITTLVLAVIMMVAVVSGCNGGTGSDKSEVEQSAGNTKSEAVVSKDTQPIEVVYVRGGDTEYFGHPDIGDIKAAIETKFFEDTGIKINFVLEPIPFGEIVQKYQTKIASKEKIDIARFWPAQAQSDSVNGYYKDLTSYVEKNMPGLSKVATVEQIEAMKFLGKFHTIYSLGSDRNFHFNIRTDILENMGITFPDSFEKLEQVMADIKAKDPSLIPFNAYSWCIDSLLMGKNYLPASGIYQDSDNTVKPIFMHPNYERFLSDYQKWYTNGWISSDVLTMSNDVIEQNVYTGKSPIFSLGGFYYWPEYIPSMLKVNSNATTRMFTGYYTDAEKSQYPYTSPLADGISVIAYASDEVANAVTKFMNWEMEDPKNYRLTHFGIEGKHYVMKGDKIEYLDGVAPYNRAYALFDTTTDFVYNPARTNWDDTFIADYEKSLEIPYLENPLANFQYVDLGDMTSPSVDATTVIQQMTNEIKLGQKPVSYLQDIKDKYYDALNGKAIDAKRNEVINSLR